MNWRDKRALVTGGGGFIGSHVADALAARGAIVTVVDNFSTGFREFVSESPSLKLVEGDLLDQSLCDRVVAKQDFVFHLAANADIKDGLLHPRRDIEQNVVATQNVLEAMRAHQVKNIAFSSTGSVYGEATVLPTPEDAPFPVQTSLYATSKIAAEGLLSSYAFGYGFRTWIFRFVSMLGPRYTHGHVVDFWRKLRADPSRLAVLGDGHQRKSYLHVSDCVAAMLLVVERTQWAGERLQHRSQRVDRGQRQHPDHLPRDARRSAARVQRRHSRLGRGLAQDLARDQALAVSRLGPHSDNRGLDRRNFALSRSESVLRAPPPVALVPGESRPEAPGNLRRRGGRNMVWTQRHGSTLLP